MSFHPKKDYFGLSGNGLVVRDSELGGSVEKYQPLNQDGDFCATEIYGADTAPSVNYAVKSAVTLADVQIGEAKAEIEGKKYALESIEISTSAGAAPTVSAKGKEVTGCDGDVLSQYILPAFSLSPRNKAQILFDAFSLGGKGCVLTECKATIECTVEVTKIAGERIASDSSQGVITVSGSIMRCGNVDGSEVPVVTPKAEDVKLGEKSAKWVLTNAPELTETNPETEYPTYSFELQLTLLKD